MGKIVVEEDICVEFVLNKLEPVIQNIKEVDFVGVEGLIQVFVEEFHEVALLRGVKMDVDKVFAQ